MDTTDSNTVGNVPIRGRQRNLGKHGRPTFGQAAHIVKRFGGEAAIARLLGIARTTPYVWQYARPYGADGLIPRHAVLRLARMARLEGVHLTAEDWALRPIDYEEEDDTNG